VRASGYLRVHVRAAVLVCALVAGAAAAPVGCTLGDAPPNCIPGASIGCTGPNGCSGSQTCLGNGNQYGECACSHPTVEPIVIDAGPDAPLPNMLGAPCIVDKDCGPLLFCLDVLSTKIFKEGPANGICVADCAKDASACKGLDPTSACRTFDDNGTTNTTSDDIAYCMRGCTTGSAPSEAKCFGRPDVACITLGTASTNGVCIPVCRNDADCGSRFCDLASGLCADGPRTGTAIGGACSASNQDECVGYCSVSLGNGYSECSGYCTNGSIGCGQSGSPPYDAFCVTPETTGGGWNGGDFGFCSKLCDCDKDCGRTDAVCSPLPAAEATAVGRKGACRSATLLGGDPRPGLPCAK